MLTVAQAAIRVGRSPETIRRWIRAERLHARRLGRRYMIDESDLLAVTGDDVPVGLAPESEHFDSGTSRPDWVRIIREAREERSAHLLEVLRNRRRTAVTPQAGVCE